MVLIEAVERGVFNEKEIAVVEYTIFHYLAGIEDLNSELILEKYQTWNYKKRANRIPLDLLKF